MMTAGRRTLLLLIVFVVGLAWAWTNRVPGGSVDAAALPPAPAVGHPAPDFTLPLAAGASGTQFTLSSLRGQPVVLNFWATWCPPCRAELPELNAASERLKGEVVIAGVNQAEARAGVEAFSRQLGLSFPIPLDESAHASQAYHVRSLPTTFFIDRNGVIRHIQVGALTEATLAQHLKTIYP
jgi:cytochrome c biogenesis protein CcmG, thiol:disulfide interchange protein DsbE